MSGEHFWVNNSYAHFELQAIADTIKEDVMDGISGDMPVQRELISQICNSLSNITRAMAYDAAGDRAMSDFEDIGSNLGDIQEFIHKYFTDRTYQKFSQALAQKSFLERLDSTSNFSRIGNKIVPLKEYYCFLIGLKGGYKSKISDKEIISKIKLTQHDFIKVSISEYLMVSYLENFFGFMEALEESGYKAFEVFQSLCDNYWATYKMPY